MVRTAGRASIPAGLLSSTAAFSTTATISATSCRFGSRTAKPPPGHPVLVRNQRQPLRPEQGLQHADDFATYLTDCFDLLYEEGADIPKVMTISLHDRLIGRPAKAAGLIKFLDHARKHDRVWFCTRQRHRGALAPHASATWFRDPPPEVRTERARMQGLSYHLSPTARGERRRSCWTPFLALSNADAKHRLWGRS